MTLTSTSSAWPPPRTQRGPLRQQVVAWVVIGVAGYLGSVGLVRLFDYSSARAQLAQLVQQAGPLYPTFSDGPAPFSLRIALTWITDWRALLIWVLTAAVTVVALTVTKRLRGSTQTGRR